MMKLFRNYICMAALILGACIVTACDDDDDDTTSISASTGIAVDVAGTRYGYTTVTSAYAEYAYYGESLRLKYNTETTVDLTYTNDTWGTYTATDIAITENSDGTCTLSGSGTATISMPGSDTSSDYDFTVSGSTDSNFALTITLTLSSVMGGTDVVFVECDYWLALYLASLDYSDGTGTVNNSSFSNLTDAGTLSVALNADGETLDITYTSTTWGEYTLTGITATVNDNDTITLEGSGTVDITYGEVSLTDQEYTLAATVSADGSEYDFLYTVEISGLGTTTIDFTNIVEEEEEEEEETDGEAADGSSLAGTYTGALNVNVVFGSTTIDYDYTDEAVEITVNDDGTINFTYDAYSDDDYDWGYYELTDVTVYESDGTYTFSEESTSTITYSSYATDYDIDCTIDGTIVSTDDFEFIISTTIMNMITVTMTVTP